MKYGNKALRLQHFSKNTHYFRSNTASKKWQKPFVFKSFLDFGYRLIHPMGGGMAYRAQKPSSI